VEAGNRIDVLDRHVGAVRDDGTRFHEALPDVGTITGALVAETLWHVRRVRRAVNALHRRDDTELAETRDIVGMQVLRVLDAPAQVATVPAGVPERRFVDIEYLAVGAVANRVDVQLKVVGNSDFGGARGRL